MRYDHALRIRTAARYRGMPVTVAGDDVDRLVVFAGYDTADPIALAVITTDPSTPDEPYRLEGVARSVKTVHEAACLAAERGEADRPQRGAFLAVAEPIVDGDD